MKDELPDIDPILLSTIERRLAPYKARLSAAQLGQLRREAIVQLSNHPYPADLVHQLRMSENAKAAKESYELAKDGAFLEEEAQHRPTPRSGGTR